MVVVVLPQAAVFAHLLCISEEVAVETTYAFLARLAG